MNQNKHVPYMWFNLILTLWKMKCAHSTLWSFIKDVCTQNWHIIKWLKMIIFIYCSLNDWFYKSIIEIIHEINELKNFKNNFIMNGKLNLISVKQI